VYYSREPHPVLPYEHSGYVTNALDDTFKVVPDSDMAYLCGNPGMVDDVYRLLCEKGLPNDRIIREKYISPKQKAAVR
jgi:NAD(P)H-flavin reductase